MASPPRQAVRRQIALLWGGGLLLCLAPAVLTASVDVGLAVQRQRRDPRLPARVALLLGSGALAAWGLGVFFADRSLGPTLDRLHETARSAADLEMPFEPGGPRLTPTHLTSAFGQLEGRLVEANGRLRAQVLRLERLNAELGAAREELLRAERLATLGRLAAGVAHEIGNPLGALLGFVEIAKGDPTQAASILPALEEAGLRIHRTLQDLMDFARPATLELAAVQLPLAIEAAARLVGAHPRWRSMRLSIDIDPSVSAVLASEHQLVQLLTNLFLNAADACEGQGAILLRGRWRDGNVELEVSDDGPGLPVGLEPQLFEPFFTTKGRGAGTGLGLAICRQIMEQFGGGIRAERGSPGAVFRLSFRPASPA